MNITLDGFMSGPSCELDWHFQSWTDEMAECLCEQLSKADTILLGRVTYDAMAKYWPSQSSNPSYPRKDIAFAEMMNNYPKIVFSKTLVTTEWNNSRLVKENILKEITKLKQTPGNDIIIYGSGTIVSFLSQLKLIDEYVLWIHPVILGKGRPLFKIYNKLNLGLIKTKTFRTGVVVVYYKCLN
jgi:dihydrofolate reductase